LVEETELALSTWANCKIMRFEDAQPVGNSKLKTRKLSFEYVVPVEEERKRWDELQNLKERVETFTAEILHRIVDIRGTLWT
jgi:hypothetical protein